MNEIISSAVLPPALFVYLAVFCFFFRRHIAARLLLGLSLLLLFLACLPATSKLLARPLTHSLPNAAQLQRFNPDVILLPTGGIFADPTGQLHPSTETQKRARLAAKLQQQLHIPIIISGGDPHETGDSEAAVVQRSLQASGPVILDTVAMNTMENAADFALLMKRNGFARPAIVTSESHMRRMLAALKPYGYPLLAYPVGEWFSRPYEPRDFLPSNSGLSRFHKTTKLYAGLFYYAFRGHITFADIFSIDRGT